jgi:hypothetical protein
MQALTNLIPSNDGANVSQDFIPEESKEDKILHFSSAKKQRTPVEQHAHPRNLIPPSQ